MPSFPTLLQDRNPVGRAIRACHHRIRANQDHGSGGLQISGTLTLAPTKSQNLQSLPVEPAVTQPVSASQWCSDHLCMCNASLQLACKQRSVLLQTQKHALADDQMPQVPATFHCNCVVPETFNCRLAVHVRLTLQQVDHAALC